MNLLPRARGRRMVAGLGLADCRRHEGKGCDDSLERGIGGSDLHLVVGVDLGNVRGREAFGGRIDRDRFEGEHVADAALLERIQVVVIVAAFDGILDGHGVKGEASDVRRALALDRHDRRKGAIAGKDLYQSLERADGRLRELVGDDERHAGRSALGLPTDRVIDRKAELFVFELRQGRRDLAVLDGADRSGGTGVARRTGRAFFIVLIRPDARDDDNDDYYGDYSPGD